MKHGSTTLESAESRSLSKGLQILEHLADAQSAFALTDLARMIDLGKASTLRLLRTLQASGYLMRDENDRYWVDPAWPSARRLLLLRHLRTAAAPRMASLNSRFGESVALAFLFDDIIRVVEVLQSTQLMRVANVPGRIIQPHASSLGKAILAFQTPERAHALLGTYGAAPVTAHTLTSFPAIQEDLAAVRQRGYAWDCEESVPGGQCVGAPVSLPAEGVLAAVSVSMPKARFTEELKKTLPRALVAAARQIGAAVARMQSP